MGDFLVDLRPRPSRSVRAAAQLQFTRQSRVCVLDEPNFGLVLTYTGDPAVWAPYRNADDGTIVVVAGRVALDEPHWEAAEALGGTGGLAAKAVYGLHQRQGVRWLDEIGGNAFILIYDAKRAELHLATDRFGVFPAFGYENGRSLLYASHPDALADAAGEHSRLDEVSMAEFVLTSTVTPPFTYYQRIRLMEHGTVHTIAFGGQGIKSRQSRHYSEINYRPEAKPDEDALAEELASALRKAVRRRTRPRFGRTAVALSGGLDSRAILACIERKDQVFAFCCYDEPNQELRVAESIAEALKVPFLRWRRPFEYYGDNAELGVRISGGMGSLANNHFLGIVDRLDAEGAETLLTGCYCDYLFKGLPLNRRTHWLTGREELAPFRHQFYFTRRLRSTPLATQARERWESRVAPEYRDQDSPSKLFQVEARRTFPLCYEGDNQQRVVPQRVTGWFLPVADREVLDVYCRLPYYFKLNRSVFSKAVRLLCDRRLARVPDANTGARLGATVAEELVSGSWLALRRKLGGVRRSISSQGSWPDWHYYVRHSRKLEELWKRPNDDAFDFFGRVLGRDNLRLEIPDYAGHDLFLLVSLLTMKIWLEQRI